MSVAAVYTVQQYEEEYEGAVRDLLLSTGWQENAIPSQDVLNEAAETGCAFVAVTDQGVVGFIRVLSDGEVCSYITELAVLAGARFQGIGRALVDAVAQEFPKARIDLLSTSLAQSFYEEIGFQAKSGYRRWPQ